MRSNLYSYSNLWNNTYDTFQMHLINSLSSKSLINQKHSSTIVKYINFSHFSTSTESSLKLGEMIHIPDLINQDFFH